jgi:hypothetical protein
LRCPAELLAFFFLFLSADVCKTKFQIFQLTACTALCKNGFMKLMETMGCRNLELSFCNTKPIKWVTVKMSIFSPILNYEH